MLSKEDEDKIQLATKIRKQPKGIMKLFCKPDYLESAELFQEVGQKQSDLKLKEKYLREAAETFQMDNGNIGPFRAYETYNALAEEYIQAKDINKGIEYMNKAAEQLSRISRHLMAGNLYMNAAKLQEGQSPANAVALYRKAISEYQMDEEGAFHIKNARKTILDVQLDSRDLSGALETLSDLDLKYSQLCKGIVGLLLGKPMEDVLDSKKESDLYIILLNRRPEEAIQALNSFIEDNTLPAYAEKIFNMARLMLLPENNIC